MAVFAVYNEFANAWYSTFLDLQHGCNIISSFDYDYSYLANVLIS